MKTLITILNTLLLLGIFLLAYHTRSDEARGREPLPEDSSDTFLRGDSDDDGAINIADALHLARYLFLRGDRPVCLSAGDADDNGKLQLADAMYLLFFIFRNGPDPAAPFPDPGQDPTPDLGCRDPVLGSLPEVNSPGGPDRELSVEEALSWRRGREFFDRPATLSGGLGPFFNGDSCRGCHLDPVIGGAGGLDVDVVRFAYVNEKDEVSQLEGGPAVSRLSRFGVVRDEIHPEANVVETRQTPTVFGLGLVDRIPNAVLLENEDADDDDRDGISGRARMVNGRVARFGHKAGVPTLRDFAADALINELGLTVAAFHSGFAVPEDLDGVDDPEVPDDLFEDLTFFISHLAPPRRQLPDDPGVLDRIATGETHFMASGCNRCHVPELAGADGPVRAYSDFLLHDVADPARYNVDEELVEPREFRTAPLWGIRDTGPYLHDGSAESIEQAILGHHGEATASREAFEALSFFDRFILVEFLESL